MGILDKLTFWKKKEDFDLRGFGDMPGEKGGPEKIPGMEQPSVFEKELSAEAGGFPEEPSTFPRTIPSEVPEEPAGPAFEMPPGGPQTAAAPPSRGYMPQPSQTRDIELISAKLDAIRAMLENINQRLANLERIAKESEHETY